MTKETIHKCKVLHDGWEMDNDLWVVQSESGPPVLMTTNHGRGVVMQILLEQNESIKPLCRAGRESKALARLRCCGG